MQFNAHRLSGVFSIQMEPRVDHRGFFMRAYDAERFAAHDIHRDWVQENHSRSTRKGTLRGLHFQFPPHCETKLVRVVQGAMLDVFVDLRKGSATFGQWGSVELSEDNHTMIYIPKGFAHGLFSLTDHCQVTYKVDRAYAPDCEGGIKWDDRSLNIPWPFPDPVISEKDRNLMSFEHFVRQYGGLAV